MKTMLSLITLGVCALTPMSSVDAQVDPARRVAVQAEAVASPKVDARRALANVPVVDPRRSAAARAGAGSLRAQQDRAVHPARSEQARVAAIRAWRMARNAESNELAQRSARQAAKLRQRG